MSNSFSKPLFQDQNALEDQSSMLLDDRRSRERTPALKEGTHLWLTDSQRVAVELIDESAGGIGIIIPAASFNLGPQVDVEYQGERRAAIVAYLKPNEDGGYRLGLEWVSPREA